MEYDERGLAYDKKLEHAVLGSIMIKYPLFQNVLSETKISKQAFYFDRNQAVFDTILKLFDEGKPPNETLVSSELNGAVPKDYIYQLVETVPAASEVIHYANRLVELHRWRDRRKAAFAALKATEERDLDQFAKAKALLDSDEIKVNSIKSPKQLGTEFEAMMESEKDDAIALPWPRFNKAMAGGLRRKQTTILGGWSSHGKSVIIDEILEKAAKDGHSTHLYINEMGIEDRVARSISRHSTIEYSKIVQHQLNDAEKQKVQQIIKEGAPYFSVTECAGWSVNELAYDIKSRKFDIVGIDILHQFDYDSESELARISRILTRITKQANCHIIATVHLNEFRASGDLRPRPVLRDIRGSGMLKNDADNVMFVFREQDPSTSNPLPSASIYTTKVRNGEMTSVPLTFLDRSFSFVESEY